MWVPVGQRSGEVSWQQRGNHPGLYGVARLKPGVSLVQAKAEMDMIGANLEKQYQDSNAGNGVQLRPLLEILVGDIRRPLWVLICRCSFCLVDCLRKHRQLAVGPSAVPAKRDGNSRSHGCWALAYCAPAAYGECLIGLDRRHARNVDRPNGGSDSFCT